MKYTLVECIALTEHGMTTEAYDKQCRKMRKLTEERDFLIDGINLLKDSSEQCDIERLQKKLKRLEKINTEISNMSDLYWLK